MDISLKFGIFRQKHFFSPRSEVFLPLRATEPGLARNTFEHQNLKTGFQKVFAFAKNFKIAIGTKKLDFSLEEVFG